MRSTFKLYTPSSRSTVTLRLWVLARDWQLILHVLLLHILVLPSLVSKFVEQRWKFHYWKEPHWSPHILAIRLTNIVLHKQREDPNIMSRGWHWETVVRGMTRIICERYCGLWGIKILRGCRCSDSEGTGTAVRICTDCAGNSCHLQRTGDQFDVPSSSTLTSVKWRATKFLNPISLLLTLTLISVMSTKKWIIYKLLLDQKSPSP